MSAGDSPNSVRHWRSRSNAFQRIGSFGGSPVARRLKAGKAAADYSFHMAITWWGEQVWKDMPEVVNRGVNTFKSYYAPGDTLDPVNIEGSVPTTTGEAIEAAGGIVYEAIFGYNQDTPLDPTTGSPWMPATGVAYTPWPSAIRITMTLHDTDTRLEIGRQIQFVIDLPRRVD